MYIHINALICNVMLYSELSCRWTVSAVRLRNPTGFSLFIYIEREITML